MILVPLSRSLSGRRSLAALALSALPAWHALHAQTERRTVSGREVAFYNIAGTVQIAHGSGREVEFEITRRGRDASKLRIETGTVRGKPTLRVIYPDDDIVYRDWNRGSGSNRDDDRGRDRRWGRNWGTSNTSSSINDDGTWGGERGWTGRRRVKVTSSGSGLEAWADIRVLVPDGQVLDANLLVGELRASDVDAELHLDVASARVVTDRTRGVLIIDTGSGGVDVRDARGPRLSVDVGSGGVALDGVRSDDCRIDTGSGGITGTGVACGRLTVDVGSGSVRLADASGDDISVDAGSGGVDLSLRSSPRNVSIESGSGRVTVALPSNYDGSVDVETGSGGISTDFAVRTTRVERNTLRGTIGDGRGRLRIETGSGGVRLRRAGS
ncbi:MAG: DUF4097 domain-containing protein [Gemmatimonadaceae bacterium]|nr:DUF4097 domain-containing protein [Gemmatimonadaceae bacterium]